jgi:hypothetical protein
MALLVVFTVLVGRHIAGMWRGALVDERNKVSLSRLQTLLWTVIVVAGFLAAALHNIRSDQSAPLEIALPPQLWILLGISATSLVGSALIKQEKMKRNPELGNAKKMLARALPGVQPEQVVKMDDSNQLVVAADSNHPTVKGPVVARGVLAVNEAKEKSSWSDMFRGEEVGNVDRLDLGKVQMFFFTVILVFSYAVALGSVLADASEKIAGFPTLDQGAVALLGISHAAYLMNKTVSSTPTTS